MAIESNLAGVVRVAYEAVTGEFNRETEHAARTYVASNEKMSDSAIKLELAQDKLRRAVAKGPAAAREQQRALLAVRAAEREVAAETNRTTGAFDKQQRELRQTNRELAETSRRARLSGSAFRSMRSGIGFAVAGLIGGTGLVYGIRESIRAGIEQDRILANLRNALARGGYSWDQYGGRVEAATAKLKAQSAFDDEELYASLQLLVRGTKDVNRALELNALAADLARGRNMDLVKAAQLVVRVEAGQIGSLRRLGINVDKNAKSYEAIAYVQRKYAGAAQAYANTAAGAQDRVTVAIGDTEKLLGRALLPTFEHYANALSDWLQDAENMKRIQDDANRAIEVGGKVIRGLAAGLRIVRAVAEPVVDALGGIEKAAELALIVGIATKARKAALGFLPLQASSASTAAKGVRDAAIFGRAWDVATRPRVMTVAERIAPYGVGPGGGRTPAPAPTRGRFPKIPPILTSNPALITAGAVLMAGGAAYRRDEYDPKRYPRIARALAQAERDGAYPPAFLDALKTLGNVNGKSIRDLSTAQLQKLEANLVPQRVGAEGGDRDRPNMGRAPGPVRTPRRRTPRGPRRRTMLDIATDLSRALTTPETTDEEKLYVEQIGRFKTQIAALERRKNLTKAQKETLQRLYGDLGAAQSSLEAIRSDREQKLVAARQDAAQRRARARTAAQRAALQRERTLDRTSPRLEAILERERKAKVTKDLDDNVRAYREELAFWRGRLRELERGTPAFEYVAGRVAKAKANLSTARAKVTEAANAADAGGSTSLELPRRLRIRALRVQLTASEKDDNELNADIERYWKQRLAHTKKTSKLYEEVLAEYVSAHTANAQAKKQAEQAVGKEELGGVFRDFLTGFEDLVRTYYPNVGAPGVGLSTATLEQLTREQTRVLRDATTRPNGASRAFDEAVFG